MAKLSKAVRIIALVFAVLLAGYAIFSMCTVVTKPNEYTVIKQFGKVVSIRSNEDGKSGLSFKIPIIQSEDKLPNTLVFYDLPVSNVITSDKKTMVADCFVLWEISDPMAFIKQLNSSRGTAESRIDVNVYNALKNTISQTTQEEVITGRDGQLVKNIRTNIGTSLDGYGITLHGVETKHLDLPDSNKASVYARMISERNQIATSYTAEGKKEAQKIRNDADQQVKVINSEAEANAQKLIAEGEAEYMKILDKAYGSPEKADFYAFVRALDAAKVTFDGEDVIYLNENNPLASLFTNGY